MIDTFLNTGARFGDRLFLALSEAEATRGDLALQLAEQVRRSGQWFMGPPDNTAVGVDVQLHDLANQESKSCRPQK